MTYSQYVDIFEDEVNKIFLLWESSELNGFTKEMLSYKENFYKAINSQLLDLNQIKSVQLQYINSIKSKIIKSDIGNIFVDLKNIKEQLIGLEKSVIYLRLKIDITKEIIDKIWNLMNTIFKKREDIQVINNLILILEDFNKNINKMLEAKNTLKNIYNLVYTKNNTNNRIRIDFYDDNNDFKIFLQKINAINQIYEEIKILFKFNKPEDVLRINRIETGSESFDLFGNKYILEFIRWFIEKVTEYLFKNFTVNGKMSKISSNIDILDKEFGLLKKIEEFNRELQESEKIDISKSKEEISKTFALVTKQTYVLISKETKIKIDNKMISLNESIRDKYIEEAEKLYLL